MIRQPLKHDNGANPAGAMVLPPAPRLCMALGAIALYFLLQFAVAVAVGIIYARVYLNFGDNGQPEALMHDSGISSTSILITLLFSCLLSVSIFHHGYHHNWRERGTRGIAVAAISTVRFGAHMLLGLVIAIVGATLTYLLTQGHSASQDINQIMQHTTLPLQLGLGLVIVTLVPLAEEILFRGILLPALIRHMPVTVAVVTDAALFALIHLPDMGWKPQGLLALALVGGVCCWRRLKTGSVYSAVAVHAGNNLLAMIVLISHH